MNTGEGRRAPVGAATVASIVIEGDAKEFGWPSGT
jgi:hypothetical protein